MTELKEREVEESKRGHEIQGEREREEVNGVWLLTGIIHRNRERETKGVWVDEGEKERRVCREEIMED